MQAGGNETRRVADGSFGRLSQQIDKLLLVFRRDSEDIDQSEQLAARSDGCHEGLPAM
jgi:hypothetical protein